MSTAAFQIYRYEGAEGPSASGILHMEGLTPTIAAGLARMGDAGLSEGHDARVLINLPGFSLVHSWFKSGYPLPLHSHDADCLYYVVAGSLRLGTETINARDGFFVPADVPYTYSPGPDGVEILEFRHETSFDMRFMAKGEAYWNKAAAAVTAHRGRWASETRPPAEPGRSEPAHVGAPSE